MLEKRTVHAFLILQNKFFSSALLALFCYLNVEIIHASI